MSNCQMRRKNGKRYAKPVVDTPLNHGWTCLRKSEIDGATIYGYKGAEVRRSFDNPWDVWIGNIDEQRGFEFDARLGTLAEMTAFVKAELDIPFNGEPVQDDAPETILESIGLAAR